MWLGSKSRRWWSHLNLTSASAMLTWGHFVFDDYLRRDAVVFGVYWGITLFFIIFCLLFAILELKTVFSEVRERRRRTQLKVEEFIESQYSLAVPGSPLNAPDAAGQDKFPADNTSQTRISTP